MIKDHNNISYKFFWGGEFSNWYLHPIIIEGIEFNCAEQYLMYCKAKLFKDEDIAKEIISTINQSEQKRLGRQVKNFNNILWDAEKENIMMKVLRAKFTGSSNTHLYSYLITHKHCEIVEASPEDRIWGIGYYANEAIENIENWGENLLGKCLTKLVKEI